LIVHPTYSSLIVLAAIVLRAAESHRGRGGMNGNGRIELRESERRVVQIRPGNRGSFGVIGAPDTAIIAKIHAYFAGRELDESYGVIVDVRETGTATRKRGNYGRPAGTAICCANDPRRIST